MQEAKVALLDGDNKDAAASYGASLPQTMKAAFIEAYGKPAAAQVKIGQRPVPQLATDTQMLVKVMCASINPIDFKITQGGLKALLALDMPYIFGYDLSGIVVQVGSKVAQFKVGDAVFARVSQSCAGTLAEYCRVEEKHAAAKPATLPHAQAAAMPLAALTAWQALAKAGVKSGSTVLVTGGAGGVGTYALQFGRILGAHVATTVSGPKVQLAKDLGAETVINYREEKFETKLKNYDAVFDTTGEAKKAFAVIRPGGHCVSINGIPTGKASFEHAEWQPGCCLMCCMSCLTCCTRCAASNKSVTYSYMFMEPRGSELQQFAAWHGEGKLRSVIDKEFALDKAADAIAYLEAGRATGKVVIRVAEVDEKEATAAAATAAAAPAERQEEGKIEAASAGLGLS